MLRMQQRQSIPRAMMTQSKDFLKRIYEHLFVCFWSSDNSSQLGNKPVF